MNTEVWNEFADIRKGMKQTGRELRTILAELITLQERIMLLETKVAWLEHNGKEEMEAEPCSIGEPMPVES